MDKSKGAIVRAKITYFFKETFRAHSKAEYREIFSRGLSVKNSGITGAFPWLYVRAFFALFILFTVNVLVLRLTNNSLFIPSVTFIGGITFTIPFIILLYELYPKRGVSLFVLISVLIGGGTVACVLSQIISLIPVPNKWIVAVVVGVLEEVFKAIPALLAIMLFKQKNPYACYLFGAAVGAGFSIIEDMGYIFRYSDIFVFNYHSDIQALIFMFLDRGMSSFCSHILWTGAIGWACSLSKRPLRSVGILVFLSSIALHICWDLPFEGWLRALDITLCIIIAAVINIVIVHKSRINTLAEEVDLNHLNTKIIREAKQMGELMRFRNAGNLTFSLTCTFLSVIILVLCAMPIGMEYTTQDYDSVEDFIAYVQDGYDISVDRNRSYDPAGDDVERRFIGEELTYVVQRASIDGIEGENYYYYGYYMNEQYRPDSIYVELENEPSRINCTEFKFGSETVWAFEVNVPRGYKYHESDGTVTAVMDAEEFSGYTLLIALCAAACGIAAGCTVILISFKIKLRRVKDEK